MSRKLVGLLLLLGASLALGSLFGEAFFRLFLHWMPPMAVSSFTESAAHAMFVTYGVLLGVAMCGWSLVAVLLSRFFRDRGGSD